MTTVNSDSTVPIPDVISPSDTVCFTIEVPNDAQQIAAFVGQIAYLSNWWAWDRDDAHNGKTLALVWLKVLGTLKQCSTVLTGVSGEEGETMLFREDCDCNLEYQCCDGTWHKVLDSVAIKALIAGSSTAGAQQPTPGGGCVAYSGQIISNQEVLIPVPVSTGDTLQLLSCVGASSSDGVFWQYAVDGLPYFAGIPGGIPSFNSGNRLPSAPTGEILVHLNGAYYQFTGGFLTVPSGITSKQPTLVLNYPLSTSPSGTVTTNVEVCYVAPVGTFSHTFSFPIDLQGWTIVNHGYGPCGSWDSAGHIIQGLEVVGTTEVRSVAMHRHFDARTITSVSVHCTFIPGDQSLGPGLACQQFFSNTGVNFIHNIVGSSVNGTGVDVAGAASAPGATDVEFYFWSDYLNGAPSGTVTVNSVTINGVGTDPF